LSSGDFFNSIGATTSLPRVPAKVSLPNLKPTLSLGGENCSSWPFPHTLAPQWSFGGRSDHNGSGSRGAGLFMCSFGISLRGSFNKGRSWRWFCRPRQLSEPRLPVAGGAFVFSAAPQQHLEFNHYFGCIRAANAL